MLISSFVVLVFLAAVLVALWPTIAASKSIWLKDGAAGVLKLRNVRVEVGVSYLVSPIPIVNYLIVQHGEFAAEGKYHAAGVRGAFDIFPRDPEQDRFPFLLTGEVVSNRMKITLEKKLYYGL